MQLIVVREHGQDSPDDRVNLLRYILSTAPLDRVMLEGLRCFGQCPRGVDVDVNGGGSPQDTRWALPRQWQRQGLIERLDPLFYDSSDGKIGGFDIRRPQPWSIITNGQFVTAINHPLLARALTAVKSDVIAVNATPDLLAYRERIRLTPNNELVGFRRSYTDSILPAPMPDVWPHHLLVRGEVLDLVLGGGLPMNFDALLDRCRTRNIRMQALNVAGVAFDLESGEGVLAMCRAALNAAAKMSPAARHGNSRAAVGRQGDDLISSQARFLGPVWIGDGVAIEPGAVIVGPSVLCDNSTIGRDAVIDSSIVGAGISVEPGRMVRNCLIAAPEPEQGRARDVVTWEGGRRQERMEVPRENGFHLWPRSFYARHIKRIADACAAAIVLALFAPVFPMIALAIKISSAGPVFFRDKRQGFRGELFDCIKFRTMRQGAEKMQEKLRFVSEVDGPQFKMADDPRITTVGRFLRETYLDEIPQFFNVLCGQMSVVGPRPSPESENTLCASWRDARLSVRPGITGLWQVCRTRVAHRDFQEWIQYDTQYVRELSAGLDLWICWRTFKRMVANFIDQF